MVNSAGMDRFSPPPAGFQPRDRSRETLKGIDLWFYLGQINDSTYPPVECQYDKTMNPNTLTNFQKLFIQYRTEIRPNYGVFISQETLQRHVFILGDTGMGKSRVSRMLAYEAVWNKQSLIAICAKQEDLHTMLHFGNTNEHVNPATAYEMNPYSDRVCRWNPFLQNAPPESIVGDVVEVIKELAGGGYMARMDNLLKNVIYLMIEHRLSFIELVEFLQNEEYRTYLLSREVKSHAAIVARDEFFIAGFNKWSKSDQVTAASPVINKVMEIIQNPFLCATLCADENDLNLETFWKEPSRLFVLTDSAILSPSACAILSSFLAKAVLRTSLRVSGPVPVSLMIDELGDMAKYLGQSIEEVAIKARSQNLRLVCACQFLKQLPEGIRHAMMGASTKLFFRPNPDDVREIASMCAAGEEYDVVEAIKVSERPFPEKKSIIAKDRNGKDIILRDDGRIKETLLELIRDGKVYHKDWDEQTPDRITIEVNGMPEISWIHEDSVSFYCDIHRPLCEPVPFKNLTDYWSKRLRRLEQGQCAAVSEGKLSGVVDVRSVPNTTAWNHAAGHFIPLEEALRILPKRKEAMRERPRPATPLPPRVAPPPARKTPDGTLT